MNCMAKKTGFEEALKELQEYADKIKQRDITLDEAIDCYEKGAKSYEKCLKILEAAKQKISYYGEDDEYYDE